MQVVITVMVLGREEGEIEAVQELVVGLGGPVFEWFLINLILGFIQDFERPEEATKHS